MIRGCVEFCVCDAEGKSRTWACIAEVEGHGVGTVTQGTPVLCSGARGCTAAGR